MNIIEFFGTNKEISTLVDYLTKEGYVAGKDFKLNGMLQEKHRLIVSGPIGLLMHYILEYLRAIDGEYNVLIYDCIRWINCREKFLMYLRLNMFEDTDLLENAYDLCMETKRTEE